MATAFPDWPFPQGDVWFTRYRPGEIDHGIIAVGPPFEANVGLFVNGVILSFANLAIWQGLYRSGFVYDDAGHVVTNYHVVEGADELKITLSDDRDFIAKVIGSDPKTDIAVLKIDGEVVREMMERGMRSLAGEAKAIDSWRRFFTPDDVVGIKVNAGGRPWVVSSHEIVAETVRQLMDVGVTPPRIFVYERFQNQMDEVNYAPHLPDGVQIVAAERANRNVDNSGYDPAVYLEADLFGDSGQLRGRRVPTRSNEDPAEKRARPGEGARAVQYRCGSAPSPDATHMRYSLLE